MIEKNFMRFDLFWCFSLTILAVGLKNFEPSLSQDGVLYAAIARQIAVNGDWFNLDGGVPPLSPFFEHPHFVFWIYAFFLKFLPHEDWAIRIPSHLVYFLQHFLILRYFSKYFGKMTAYFSSVFFVLMTSFAGWHSNTLLDPFFLIFSVVALAAVAEKKYISSGVFVALAFMSKGLTVLALGVPFVVALFVFSERLWTKKIKALASATLGLVVVLAAYFFLIKFLGKSDFFESYWDRHITNRFAKTWNWQNLISWPYWKPIFFETIFLFPIAIYTFIKNFINPWSKVGLAWALFFAAMYAPAGRTGAWYLLPFHWVSVLGLMVAVRC